MITVNPLGQFGPPPPPPPAELFTTQLADRALRSAMGSAQAARYQDASLYTKEQVLKKVSPRHYSYYLSRKARWLAVAGRAIPPATVAQRVTAPPPAIEHVTLVTPAPPIEHVTMVTPPGPIVYETPVPVAPPPPPAAELFLSQLADRYLRYALGSRQAATWRPAALFVKEQALQKSSPRHYAAYLRMKAKWLATAQRAVTPVPHRIVRPAPAPTVLPPSLMQMLDRYLRYSVGRTRATAMRTASVPAKEAALRTASAYRYRRYMRSKERWLERR